MKLFRVFGLVAAVCSFTLMLIPAPASAIPAFARRYGVSCSTCHDAWPHLNDTGWSFKMSGYRRLNGRSLEPTTKDIDVAMGALTIPSIPPLALTATTGFDWRSDKRINSNNTSATRTGSSIDLDSVEIFAGAPLGAHLSTFLEFPMFETHAIQNDFPTGPGEAANTVGPGTRRSIQFSSETTVFEAAKLQWNSVFPESIAPADSLNIVAGAYQLPTAYSPEANRLSVTPYLIYRRRALDLLSPIALGSLPGSDDFSDLFRIGEPQLQIAINGVLVPFGQLTDLGKTETFVIEYDFGVANGNNNTAADRNTQKDLFGRLAVKWFGQTLGVFGYWSPDIYDDAQRTNNAVVVGGVLSGLQRPNRTSVVGPDLTLSLEPFGIPVYVENQVLFNHESDPTGFGKSFNWWGGFSQLNVRVIKPVTLYGRYDWLRGDRFDDTALGGVSGPVKPREWAGVLGADWFVLENLKLTAEGSRREFENSASTPRHQRVEEDFVTLRASIGF